MVRQFSLTALAGCATLAKLRRERHAEELLPVLGGRESVSFDALVTF